MEYSKKIEANQAAELISEEKWFDCLDSFSSNMCRVKQRKTEKLDELRKCDELLICLKAGIKKTSLG